MAKSTHSRTIFSSAAAAALAGTAVAALLAGNVATLADAGSAAADAQLSLANPDVSLCGAVGAAGESHRSNKPHSRRHNVNPGRTCASGG